MKRCSAALCIGALTVLAFSSSTKTYADPVEPAPRKNDPAAERPLENVLLQKGDPAAWTPQDPYNLSGPAPSADKIREAIWQSLTWVLDQQSADGSWDVVLTGTMLSMVADQAMDAIAVTSLAALSLAPHAALDARVEPALLKAAEFVCNRILRGKLSYTVDYAVWRYTLSLNFMLQRYESTPDATLKSLYKTTARRCANALLRMQLSNGEQPLLDSRRRSTATGKLRLPARSGLVMALPTETDYRGGALVESVVEGSAAAKAGIKAGDRVTGVDTLSVENAVDFYEYELDFAQSEKVSLALRAADGTARTAALELPATWPIYTGIVPGGNADAAPTAGHFLLRSPAMKAGMEVDDKIVAINGNPVASHADFWKHQDGLKIGQSVSIKVERAGVAKTITFAAEYAPAASLDITGLTEDKIAAEGLTVSPYHGSGPKPPGHAALNRFPGFTALRLGMNVGDRITHVNETPIIGLDHWLQLSSSIPAGRAVTVHWLRGTEKMSGSVVPNALVAPGHLDVGFAGANYIKGIGAAEPRVMFVYETGAAHKAGMKPGDVITHIGGRATPDRTSIFETLAYHTAGDEVEVSILRRGTALKLKVTLSHAAESPVEEGGWAYYPANGYSTTHSTTAAMLALYDARDKLGLAVPRSSLAAAERLMENMRVTDPNNAGIETYLYSSSSKLESMPEAALNLFSQHQGALGRVCICEYTMVRAGKRTKAHLQKSVELFLKNRDILDQVRDFWHTHLYKQWGNAAYYWMYGHHWAMVAAREVGGKTFETTNELVLKALMADREKDGTWLEHVSFGKLCGTCQALWIFGQTEGAHRKP